MKNTIIYLLGFPGTGKYTIAREIVKQENFKLVDNHLINNPLFSLIPNDGVTPLPQNIWKNVGEVWKAVLDTIVHIAPREYNFVLTNALTEGDEVDRQWFNNVINGAVKKGATFVPVRLSCSVEEMERRIVQPDRKERMKETNILSPRRNVETRMVLKTDHPNLLNLDVTNLSPAQAAEQILNHVRALQ